ncbi:MAG: polysaccharide biosynthesis/export family protein [Nitrospirota bacterium]
MKVKIPFFLIVMISLAFCFIIISGCATTNINPEISKESASPVSGEAIREIKITEFILGPGDKVEISVYRHDDLKRTIQIDTSGKITYPLVGDIQASGLSIFQLRDRVREKLSKYIVDPDVSVGVMAVQSQKVVVLGEVKNPGLFSLEAPMNALEAISRAGGPTSDAKQGNVLLIRGGVKNPELITLDIGSILSGHDMAQNVYLQNGDIIYVPATFIANVSRFFEHLSKIISPIVSMEAGYYIGQQIEKGGATTAISPK